METFLWSGEDRIAGAVEVPETTGYRPHAAERVLFAHSFKNLQAPPSIASTCPFSFRLNGQLGLSLSDSQFFYRAFESFEDYTARE